MFKRLDFDDELLQIALFESIITSLFFLPSEISPFDSAAAATCGRFFFYLISLCFIM